MAITIPADGEPVKVASPADDNREYDFEVDGNDILVARSRRNAQDPYGPSKRFRDNDRGTVKRGQNEELWAYNDDPDNTGVDATLTLDRAGFAVTYGARFSVSSEAEITSDPSRQLGQAQIQDSGQSVIDPLNQSDAAPRTDTDSAAGSGNAAEVDLGDLRGEASIHYDTSGSATLTVEVSTDGTNWRELDTHTVGSADNGIRHYKTAYQHIRAYLNQNRNLVEISARGF